MISYSHLLSGLTYIYITKLYFIYALITYIYIYIYIYIYMYVYIYIYIYNNNSRILYINAIQQSYGDQCLNMVIINIMYVT